MGRHLLRCALLVLLSVSASVSWSARPALAQGQLEWPLHVRGGEITDGSASPDISERIIDFTTDADGNVYVVGDFGPANSEIRIGTATLTAIGQRDIFVASFDATGVTRWVKQASAVQGDTALESENHAVAIGVDPIGQSVYVVGSVPSVDNGDAEYVATADRPVTQVDGGWIGRLETGTGLWQGIESLARGPVASVLVYGVWRAKLAFAGDAQAWEAGEGIVWAVGSRTPGGDATAIARDLDVGPGDDFDVNSFRAFATRVSADLSQQTGQLLFAPPNIPTQGAALDLAYAPNTGGATGQLDRFAVVGWFANPTCGGANPLPGGNQFFLAIYEENPSFPGSSSEPWTCQSIVGLADSNVPDRGVAVWNAPSVAADSSGNVYVHAGDRLMKFSIFDGSQVSELTSEILPPEAGVSPDARGGSVVVAGNEVWVSGVSEARDLFVPDVYVAKARQTTVNLQTVFEWQWTQKIAPEPAIESPTVLASAELRLDAPRSRLYLGGALRGIARFENPSGTSATVVSSSLSAARAKDGHLIFDGVDDVLQLPGEMLDFGGVNDYSQGLTIEFWARLDGFGGTRNFVPILSAARVGQDNELLVGFSPTGTSMTLWWQGVSYAVPLSESVERDPASDRWDHFAVEIRRGVLSKLTLFKNGAQIGVLNAAPGSFDADLSVASGGLFIGQEQDSLGGGFDPNQSLSGRIDDLRIWAEPLGGTLVAAHYFEKIGFTFGELESPPVEVSRYTFDEGQGSVAADALGTPAVGVDDGVLAPDSTAPTWGPTGPFDLRGPYATNYFITPTGSPLRPGGELDGYLMPLDAGGGDWFLPGTWDIGSAIAPPTGVAREQSSCPAVWSPLAEPAILASDGSPIPSGQFVWNGDLQQLYPIAPTEATVVWQPQCGGPSKQQTGVSVFPALPQDHVLGASAVVDPAPGTLPEPGAATAWSYLDQVYPGLGGSFVAESPAYGGQRVFSRDAIAPGESRYAVLRFERTLDTGDAEWQFRVVRSYDWRAASPVGPVQTGLACTIGSPLGHPMLPAQPEPGGRTGAVLTALARYDTGGTPLVYDPATRLGQIVPVNTDDLPLEPESEMAVAWYTPDPIGLYWPDVAARYECGWPAPVGQRLIRLDTFVGASEVVPDGPGVGIVSQGDPSLPGYNPNEEHAVLLPSGTGSGSKVFALRSDLNAELQTQTGGGSDPYVIVRQRLGTGLWTHRVYPVFASLNPVPFSDGLAATVGTLLQAPRPLFDLPGCEGLTLANPEPDESLLNGASPVWRSQEPRLHVRQGDASFQLRFFYPLAADFHTAGIEGLDGLPPGTCVPWLDRLDGSYDAASPEHQEIEYFSFWPTLQTTPFLRIGETVIGAKPSYDPDGPGGATFERAALPDVYGSGAARIIYDENFSQAAGEVQSTAVLYDPVSERGVPLAAVPGAIATSVSLVTGKLTFTDLRAVLRDRLGWNSTSKTLTFGGVLDASGVGDAWVRPNVMTARDRAAIDADLDLKDGGSCKTSLQSFCDALDALQQRTRNPNCLDLAGSASSPEGPYRVGLADGGKTCDAPGAPDGNAELEAFGAGPKVLSAAATPAAGWVSVALEDGTGNPVSVVPVRIDCPLFAGELKVIESDDIFEERLTLHHSGDFAGLADDLDFEWRYQFAPSGPAPNGDATYFESASWQTPPGSGPGEVSFTIQGPGKLNLADSYWVARYQSDVCAAPAEGGALSTWAGSPNNDPVITTAQLAEGWMKRVIRALSPFAQRIADYHTGTINTLASMLSVAGEPYVGSVALNSASEDLGSQGLIELYRSVLDRGSSLSIDQGISDPAINTQILFAASNIVDLYTLLANEAYADASDPTIGFSTSSSFGSLSSSLFAFQNQLDTPLEEELVLLRGRNDPTGGAFPIYNRLIWNLTGGSAEAAYVSTYQITDQNAADGVTVDDARILYPQGHGDAWGHYLSATESYYELLRNEAFFWLPRTETVLVAGLPVPVDYEDERKFARVAATRARVGAEIVNLTYRDAYVADPAAQWQGYKDTDPDRAWGLDGWARRAGQAAYFDWLTVTAVLPAQDPQSCRIEPTPSPCNEGIQEIDRSTVPELGAIAAEFGAIQARVDEADRGLNPLGLDPGAIPFDIDPNFTQVASQLQGQSHFEQIAERAVKALQNTVAVFDYASQASQSLRDTQDQADAQADLALEQDTDFKHRLIELMGTPFTGDIGAGKLYPSGYTGPDLLHFDYVSTEIVGDLAIAPPDESYSVNLFPTTAPSEDGSSTEEKCYFTGDLPGGFDQSAICSGDAPLSVDFPTASGGDWPYVATPAMGARFSPGEIQLAISEMLQAQASFRQAQLDHQNLLADIRAQAALLERTTAIDAAQVEVFNTLENETINLNNRIEQLELDNIILNRSASATRDVAESLFAFQGADFSSGCSIVCGVLGSVALAAANFMEIATDVNQTIINTKTFDRDELALTAQLEVEQLGAAQNALVGRAEIEALVREVPGRRLALAQAAEVLQQALQRYQQLRAEAGRILEERRNFNVLASAATQENRYRDLTFRNFRNEALQKYRAQVDLAARYVYLAANAYDYETNLLSSESGAGRGFLTDIVRERRLGQMQAGVPVPGVPGLTDVMGRLLQNYDVLEGQLGFNNPQIETNRFSLRREFQRIAADASGDGAWRDRLESWRVANIWDDPDFRRYARPFTVEALGPQPALVIPFETTVNFGSNFFGRQLAGGDSSYDPTQFATKIRSVGVWFEGYDASGLSNTPRIYLIPTGMDVMRSPSAFSLETREFRVVDQRIPEPFPIGASDLVDPGWIPTNDSLSGRFTDVRRFASFRAYHDSGGFDPSETTTDTRLVGRSVWNTQWKMIIPGGTLLFDADDGLDTFIEGDEIFPGAGVRTGDGISDIRIFFETYGYAGF